MDGLPVKGGKEDIHDESLSWMSPLGGEGGDMMPTAWNTRRAIRAMSFVASPRDLSRRAFFLSAGAAGIGLGRAGLAPARELVRSGTLGRIVFCRAFQGHGRDSLGALQFLLDAPPPVSVTEHSPGCATLRYPGFIASLERTGTRQEYDIVICGSYATLAVKRNGRRLFRQEA
jgi:hypothetical protein